jgi:hypothetical protein
MVAVTPELIYTLMLEIHAEQRAAEQQRATDQKANHADIDGLKDTVEGMAQTLIGVRRDVRSLQAEVATPNRRC